MHWKFDPPLEAIERAKDAAAKRVVTKLHKGGEEAEEEAEEEEEHHHLPFLSGGHAGGAIDDRPSAALFQQLFKTQYEAEEETEEESLRKVLDSLNALDSLKELDERKTKDTLDRLVDRESVKKKKKSMAERREERLQALARVGGRGLGAEGVGGRTSKRAYIAAHIRSTRAEQSRGEQRRAGQGTQRRNTFARSAAFATPKSVASLAKSAALVADKQHTGKLERNGGRRQTGFFNKFAGKLVTSASAPHLGE